MGEMYMKKLSANLLLMVISVSVALVIAEVAAQIYVNSVVFQGKIFIPDDVTGWRTKPNLDLKRQLPGDDNFWKIKTNENGFRKEENWESSNKKILILGDSFAFGHGVNIEDRFDTKMKTNGYSILNTGVTGYGTDQQFLGSKPFLDQLNKDDILILLTTTINDFHETSLNYYYGRAKPWYEISDDKLKLHTPKITIREILRDKSYIYSKLSSLISAQYQPSDEDVTRATNIYKNIIKAETDGLIKKGTHIIIAYFGIETIKVKNQKDRINMTMTNICQNRVNNCLNIDKYFDTDNSKDNYLIDGHWNKKGNEVLARLLSKKISQIVK